MPPKGGDHQLLDDTAFDDSRRRRSSKYAAEHEHERAVMSGRGDRESDRGEKRQPRRRTSEDKARAPRGDDDDGEVPATLSFTPPQNEKVCSCCSFELHLFVLSWLHSSPHLLITQGAKHHQVILLTTFMFNSPSRSSNRTAAGIL